MFNLFRKKPIQSEILSDINSAKKSIKVAVSWLTDKVLIEALLRKRNEGINVEVLMSADPYNIINFELFKKLQSIGGKVKKWGKSNSLNGSFMHIKAYIVDDSVAKAGSYNWSVNAQTNAETLHKVDVQLREEIDYYFLNSKDFFHDIENPELLKKQIVQELDNMKREKAISDPSPEQFQNYRDSQEIKRGVEREYKEKQQIIDQQNAIKEKEWKEREAKLKEQQMVKDRELIEAKAKLQKEQEERQKVQNNINTSINNTSQYEPKATTQSTKLPPTSDYASN